MITKSKLKEQIEKAVQQLHETDPETYEHRHYIKQLQKYKIVINELMLAAERKPRRGSHNITNGQLYLNNREQLCNTGIRD